MHNRALVLMTALIPTIGHKNLVMYAKSLAYEVDVMICTRNFEPINGITRHSAFLNEFNNISGINFILYNDDGALQNPEDNINFWNIWRDIILKNTKLQKGDIVVASEMYGYNLAEVLECKFYPYDLQREIMNVKGEYVRNDIVQNFSNIMSSFQPYLQTTITLYGAECCGKTTTSKYLTNHLVNGYFLPEWARAYLESIEGPAITKQLMEDIIEG